MALSFLIIEFLLFVMIRWVQNPGGTRKKD